MQFSMFLDKKSTIIDDKTYSKSL